MDSQPELTDEMLVTNALTDKEAFGMLIARYEAPLSRYIRRLGIQNSEDVTDILQEVFIKAYRSLNDFDVSLKFSSWIYRIARNETISAFRKRNVRPEGHLVENGDMVMEFISNDEWGSERHFDATLNADAIGRAIEALDEKYREIIILRFFEHKEYTEISDIMRIPIGSVGTLLHRAKQQLAARIETHKLSI